MFMYVYVFSTAEGSDGKMVGALAQINSPEEIFTPQEMFLL